MISFQQIKLGEITTKIGSGATPRGGQGSYGNSGIPLIRSLNVYDLFFDYDNLAFINQDQATKLANVEVIKGDVLLNITGASVGRCTSVPNNLVPARVNQHVSIIRANKEKLNGTYLKYLLVSHYYKKRLLGLAGTGGTREALTKSDIENFSVSLPSINIQSQIASALSSYDELILNNEKRIKILEETAQRIYAEWFVKLKFPEYEKVEIINGIPENWEYKKIDDIAVVIRGTSYTSEQINDDQGDYYLVNLKSFNRGGGFNFNGAKYFNGAVKNNQVLNQGDIVVAVTDMTTDRAVISRPARIPNIKSNKVTFSADVVKIVPEKLPFAYLYYSMLDYRFTETTKNKANGANVLHLKPQAISEYKVLVPTLGLLEKFERACSDTVRLSDKLSEENEKLTKMRDSLLPQLITGRRELIS